MYNSKADVTTELSCDIFVFSMLVKELLSEINDVPQGLLGLKKLIRHTLELIINLTL